VLKSVESTRQAPDDNHSTRQVYIGTRRSTMLDWNILYSISILNSMSARPQVDGITPGWIKTDSGD